MTPEWQAVAIFCEDIREEVGNLSTIVGTLPDTIQVAQTPVSLPKLGVYLRVQLATDSKIESFSPKLRFADGSEMPLGSIDPELVKNNKRDAAAFDAPSTGFIMKAVAAPFKVMMPGRISVLLEIDGETHICGYINVTVDQAGA